MAEVLPANPQATTDRSAIAPLCVLGCCPNTSARFTARFTELSLIGKIFCFLYITCSIVAVAIIGFWGIILFLFFPCLFLIVRYLWCRLCRDTFSDSIGPHATQLGTLRNALVWALCKTKKKKEEDGDADKEKGNGNAAYTVIQTSWAHVATIVFHLWLFLSFSGAFLARPLGYASVSVPIFLILFYNAFGAIMFLIVAVWLADFFHLLLEAALCVRFHASKQEHTLVDSNDKDNNVESKAEPTSITAATVTATMQTMAATTTPDMKNYIPQRVARVRAAVALFAFALFSVFSGNAAYSDPKTIEISLPIARLPECADGFKLAMISDLHAGPLVGDTETRRFVEIVNSWSPQAVALVGDIGDMEVNRELEEKLAPLSGLSAPTFWTPGNHEHISGIEDYRDLFAAGADGPLGIDITTLENSRTSITIAGEGDCSFDIAGVGDHSSNHMPRPDLSAALDGWDSTQALVLLSHQPFDFPEAAEAGVGLMLSGHTHGGQIWPTHAGVWMVYGKYIQGLFSHGASWLYVSAGAVGWGPRVRSLSVPELTLFTLRNPALFEAAGESTTEVESLGVSAIGMYTSLAMLPLSLLVCLLRACGMLRCRAAVEEGYKSWQN